MLGQPSPTIPSSPEVRNVYDLQGLCNTIIFETNPITSHRIYDGMFTYIYIYIIVDVFGQFR